MQDWQLTVFQSGTQVVQRRGLGAHYHIGHLAADNEGDHGRFDVGNELCGWLNGGMSPWWIDLLRRISPESVITPHGCQISATGPMIDVAEHGWGCWAQDESKDAQITRGLMADALEKMDRKLLEKISA